VNTRALSSSWFDPALTTLVLVAAACSSSSDASGGDVAFHAEAPVLPDFSYDTGLQPPVGPARVSLKLTAAGSIAVDTAAESAGDKLEGKAGAGKLKLDMHLKFEGHLKVDAGTVKYDGDVPGLKNLDVPIAGASSFDGFAQTSPAQITADVPEAKLPDVPLGTVPGHLTITIASGSKVVTSYQSSCLDVRGEHATLRGASTTSGKIVVKTSIVLDIPLFSKSFDLPDMIVDVPASVKSLDSAPASAPGIADGTDGTCTPPANSDGGTPSADGGIDAPPAGEDAGSDSPSDTASGSASDSASVGSTCPATVNTGIPAATLAWQLRAALSLPRACSTRSAPPCPTANTTARPATKPATTRARPPTPRGSPFSTVPTIVKTRSIPRPANDASARDGARDAPVVALGPSEERWLTSRTMQTGEKEKLAIFVAERGPKLTYQRRDASSSYSVRTEGAPLPFRAILVA
jgi:hypothetical protein